MTHAQLRAVGELLAILPVDDLLVVRIREDPRGSAPRGVLEVSLRDHWERRLVSIDRKGVVSAREHRIDRSIPGQTRLV